MTELVSYPIRRQALQLTERDPFILRHQTFIKTRMRPDPNMHSELELGVCLSGCTRRHFGEYYRDCRAGDVWFCGTWQPHGSQIIEVPCEYLILMITPSLMTDLYFPEEPDVFWMRPFTVAPEDRPLVSDRTRGEVMRLTRRIGACGIGEGYWKVRLRLLVLELVTLLLEEDDAQDPSGRAPGAYRAIAPAVALAVESQRLVTVEEAAAACGMSRNTFLRHFEHLMGMSFSTFALRHRFGNAARELLETQHPIKAIARRWGFADASHLNRVFQRFAECSPHEYRQQVLRSARFESP